MSLDPLRVNQPDRRKRKPTSTSSFGVGRRESHDSSSFYSRFSAPEVSDDETVNRVAVRDEIFLADARDMSQIPDSSIALVVTSPPYFAGKEYEAVLGDGDVPGSYIEYLSMLADVLAECRRVLEPGGRMCINVANLGRKPYRSLSSDVISILQDELKFLLRGEVIWMKAEGAAGSCAWGSYMSATNPVLRDTTERLIIASKGRFERALSTKAKRRRRELGLPHEDDISTEEFVEATLDVWKIRPESAKRVGHPAPFPVELPERCIKLFTYRGDVILDPFMGSGSTAIAATRNGRHYLGYELDEKYLELARERIAAESL
jgi:site-specific DNA-methyltransferase (adenine-specific)